MMPLLSVIIPMRNNEQQITTALNSIASQNLPIEIIVVDDASTDGSIDTVAEWSRVHTDINLKLLRQMEHGYTLNAQLVGLKQASGEDIMFMDADDRWLENKGLERALYLKQKSGCELLHFRTLGIKDNGEECGEVEWAKPPHIGNLQGNSVFSAYCSCLYPPLLIWNKIYSKTLLDHAAKFANGKTIYRFNDKFLISLVLTQAKSYIGCNEYIYVYKFSQNWTMAKYAGRVHDLKILLETIKPILDSGDIKPEDADLFKKFLNHRITNNTGNMCIEIVKRLDMGQEYDSILSELNQFLSEEELFHLTLFATSNNVHSALSIAKRIRYEF